MRKKCRVWKYYERIVKEVLKSAFLGNERKYTDREGRIFGLIQSFIVFIGLYE